MRFGSSLAQVDKVLVFDAARLKNALDEIDTEFERTQPHAVQRNVAGSSQIARQMSGSCEWMRRPRTKQS